jgi:hypothetical protein
MDNTSEYINGLKATHAKRLKALIDQRRNSPSTSEIRKNAKVEKDKKIADRMRRQERY